MNAWYALTSEVRPHDRRSLTSTLMSIIDHQSRKSIAIVNRRSWIVNFSTIDRRSPIVTFTIDRRSSIVTVKNYYKKQSKKLLNQTCSNCKRKWFVGLFECFFGQLPSKVMWTNGSLTQKPCFSQSIWSLLFVVNQLFSQKWRSGLSKANFCAKTVGTVFAVFVFLSPS